MTSRWCALGSASRSYPCLRQGHWTQSAGGQGDRTRRLLATAREVESQRGHTIIMCNLKSRLSVTDGQAMPPPDEPSGLGPACAIAGRLRTQRGPMRDSLPRAGDAGPVRSLGRPHDGTGRHSRCRRSRSAAPVFGHFLDGPAAPGMLPESPHRLGDRRRGAACGDRALRL